MKNTVGSRRKIKKIKKINVSKLLNKYYGVLPTFPDVTKLRVSRRKRIDL